MSWDPDAPTESDSEYDGVLSYATEYHALAVGGVAGLCGALTYGTPMQPAGLGLMIAVAATALGVKTSKRLRSALAAREVTKEPWYAVGGLVLLFLLGSVIRLVVFA